MMAELSAAAGFHHDYHPAAKMGVTRTKAYGTDSWPE